MTVHFAQSQMVPGVGLPPPTFGIGSSLTNLLGVQLGPRGKQDHWGARLVSPHLPSGMNLPRWL